MDRTVAPGYTRLGPAVRRHLSTWPADPPPDALAGKRALVTGASSGLGAATAEGLAALGAEVVLVVRDTDKGAKVVREIQGRLPLAPLDVQRCDLADLDDVRRFAAADRRRRGRAGAQRRRDAADPDRVAAGPRDDDGAARALAGADDRAAGRSGCATAGWCW